MSIKNLLFIPVWFIIFGIIPKCYGQTIADSVPSKCLNKTYIKSYFTDAKKLILSPSEWSKGEWITAATIATATATVFVFDDEIAAFAQKNRNPELDKLDYYFFDPFGKMYYTLPFMGAFYLYGVASKKNKPKVVALDFVKASVYSGIVITGIKQLAHRHRPYQTNPPNPYLWDGPITKNLEYNSFASGHTIMAWTFAAVIATHYHDQQWIPITVYSLATLEAMARVYANKHWTSDVIVGAALGYAIGKWVVNNNKYCNLSFSPVVGSNYSGMNLNFRFGIPKQAMGSLSLER